MIPIEYLWYIIGVVSVPTFILIYLKALKRNREDKARAALRRRRFERTMKSPTVRKQNTGKVPAAVENTSKDNHWLSGVKLPPKRDESETSGHWLEHVKPKHKHWLDNLRRK